MCGSHSSPAYCVITDPPQFTMLTYRQPLLAKDRFDTPILTNGSQPVIWAMGPVNSKVNI